MFRVDGLAETDLAFNDRARPWGAQHQAGAAAFRVQSEVAHDDVEMTHFLFGQLQFGVELVELGADHGLIAADYLFAAAMLQSQLSQGLGLLLASQRLRILRPRHFQITGGNDTHFEEALHSFHVFLAEAAGRLAHVEFGGAGNHFGARFFQRPAGFIAQADGLGALGLAGARLVVAQFGVVVFCHQFGNFRTGDDGQSLAGPDVVAYGTVDFTHAAGNRAADVAFPVRVGGQVANRHHLILERLAGDGGGFQRSVLLEWRGGTAWGRRGGALMPKEIAQADGGQQTEDPEKRLIHGVPSLSLRGRS